MSVLQGVWDSCSVRIVKDVRIPLALMSANVQMEQSSSQILLSKVSSAVSHWREKNFQLSFISITVVFVSSHSLYVDIIQCAA